MSKNKIWMKMKDAKVLYRCLLLSSLSMAIYMVSGSPAYAFVNFCGPVANVVASLLPAMATIGVVIIGVSAMLGRIEWKTAILCAVGVAIAFGSGSIITLLGGYGCIA